MTDKFRIRELLSRYSTNNATVAETEELFRLLEEDGFEEEYQQFFLENATTADPGYRREDWNKMLANIKSRKRYNTPVKTMLLRIAAAAVILILFTAAAYFYFNNKPDAQQQIAVQSLDDIHPGSDRAVLTLADGRKIELTGQQIINDGNITIKNINNGLVYEQSDRTVINTMSTPRGGQYKLQLPDGSRVWLNASSSITYPTSFTGKLREVKMTGEAYFEIVKDASMPFVVNVDGQKVEVLGTAFNINAYSNEPVFQTTLLEGSIKLGNNILKPGQAWRNGNIVAANTAEVVAWKKGLFKFSSADLKTVMRQLERWYDIEVRYEGEIPDEVFKGEMERSLKLSDIMEVLSFMEIGYRLENGNVLVITGKNKG